MEAKKEIIRPDLRVLEIRTDAIKAFDERNSFLGRVTEDIEKTRANIYSNLPVFQVPINAPKLGEPSKEITQTVRTPKMEMKGLSANFIAPQFKKKPSP